MSLSEFRKRSMARSGEALFFAVAFIVAVVLQLAVILRVAGVISW